MPVDGHFTYVHTKLFSFGPQNVSVNPEVPLMEMSTIRQFQVYYESAVSDTFKTYFESKLSVILLLLECFHVQAVLTLMVTVSTTHERLNLFLYSLRVSVSN